MAQYEIEVDSQDEFYDSNAPISDIQTTVNSDVDIKMKNDTAAHIRSVVKRKGRGFSAEEPSTQVLGGIKHFDTLREEVSGRALRCKKNKFKCFLFNIMFCTLLCFILFYFIQAVEGWVIFVSNLNEEVSEEEVQDKFADFGKVRDVRMNLDHRTGYVKGYALIEFDEYKAAVQAIEELDGKDWLGNSLSLDFCFVKPNESPRYH